MDGWDGVGLREMSGWDGVGPREMSFRVRWDESERERKEWKKMCSGIILINPVEKNNSFF